MTFEELWNSKYQYLIQIDRATCNSIWIDAVNSLQHDGKFEAWWNYHKGKNSIKTNEQAACWAWFVQQQRVDSLESDLEKIAALLNIDTTSINIKDIRTIIIDKLSNRTS